VKLSHGAVPMTGVLTTCEPLDTAGVFAARLEDAALALSVCQGHDPADRRTRAVPHADLLAAARSAPPVTPRVAIVGGPFFADASDDVKGLFDELAGLLGDAADRVDLPDVFENAFPAHMNLMKAGFARNLRNYRERGEAHLSAAMREALDEGAQVRASDYLAALDWQEVLRGGLAPVFDRFDAVLTPAAPGEAPASLATTGDGRFNALWTFLGAPSATVPAGTGSSGLPIGIQIVGRPGEDARLLRNAAWIAGRLATR